MEAEKLSVDDRHALSPLRAREWRGALTEAQFVERNVRLYRHRYASAITTWALRAADGTVPVSLDVLDFPVLTTGGHRRRAGLIASVVTDPDHRGRGLASRLLGQVFAAEPERPFVLYSDIGPDFYRRFAFHPSPTVAIDAPASGTEAMARIDADEFLRRLQVRRAREIAASPVPALVLEPSLDFLDWVLERFRHAAVAAGRPFPDEVLFGARHDGDDHAIAIVPSYQAGRAELLWMPRGCGACLEAAAAIAARAGFRTVRRWEPYDGKSPAKVEWPMVRWPAAEATGAPRFLEAHLLDWW